MSPSSVGTAAPKRSMNLETSTPASKVLKKKQGSSAGASKRTASSSTKLVTAGSDTNSEGDTIEVAQQPSKVAKKQPFKVVKKQPSSSKVDIAAKVRLPSSPVVASSPADASEYSAESSTISKESSPKMASGVLHAHNSSANNPLEPTTASLESMAAAGLASSGPDEFEYPRITMKARRAELEKTKSSSHAAFWAAETANLCNTMRDSGALFNHGLATITLALTEACQTQDVDESEKLLAGAMTRLHELRIGFNGFASTATNNVVQRAKDCGAPELEGLEKSMAIYEKPKIAGSNIEEKAIMPKQRHPNESLFDTAGVCRVKRPQNPALVAALARMHEDTPDADFYGE